MLRSDYNENTRTAEVVARKRLFADVPLAFNVHPIYDDIVPLTDLEAIKQSVRNLVMTDYYEIPFHPEIGSNISSLLFENAGIYTTGLIENEIRRVLTKYEPRINDIEVEVIDEPDKNAIGVSIYFKIVGLEQLVNVSFYLSRQR